jgi:Carboxylesterase family
MPRIVIESFVRFPDVTLSHKCTQEHRGLLKKDTLHSQDLLVKTMLLILHLLNAATCLPLLDTDPTIRNLEYGSFKGKVDNNSITFYNIPFAAPPVGPLRFKPPQPPLNLTGKGLIDATKAGNHN